MAVSSPRPRAVTSNSLHEFRLRQRLAAAHASTRRRTSRRTRRLPRPRGSRRPRSRVDRTSRGPWRDRRRRTRRSRRSAAGRSRPFRRCRGRWRERRTRRQAPIALVSCRCSGRGRKDELGRVALALGVGAPCARQRTSLEEDERSDPRHRHGARTSGCRRSDRALDSRVVSRRSCCTPGSCPRPGSEAVLGSSG